MTDQPAAKLWGGRFEAETDPLIERLNNSLAFDARLWREDIEGSIAHASMLGRTGIIPASEADLIVAGLREILAGLADGSIAFDPGAEDVHTAVESLLRARIGPVAGKLHTARSRNDQVATDMRMYMRRVVGEIRAAVAELQRALLETAERELGVIMPGFTHLQHAQPILLSHHLLAYFWMLQRDRERLMDAERRTSVLPLGAGALAGTSFPVDRQMVAEALGFERVSENSLDAVSDRDFLMEFLMAAAILMVHCSRLGEELVLWSSQEFGFVTLSDAVTTGSSIMPQKKNPDIAELARGKAGRVIGDAVSLLTTMKGLPLAYNKDMQEDKEAVFDAVDTVLVTVPALTLTIRTAAFHAERMQTAMRRDFSTATDLADALVRGGMAFRDAHGVVGRLVRTCIARGIGLEDLSSEQIAELAPEARGLDLAGLTVEHSIASRSVQGGTGTDAVKIQIAAARAALTS
ncbi:MAG: argininosuccinate lyase [Chthonomonadales bacterium]|nr:argininosuccinate lyase [Chthonomonadales bacterium]